MKVVVNVLGISHGSGRLGDRVRRHVSPGEPDERVRFTRGLAGSGARMMELA